MESCLYFSTFSLYVFYLYAVVLCIRCTAMCDFDGHSIVIRPTAVRAILTDIICQTIVQHCRTSDLELTATCRIKLRLSLYFHIQT